MLAETLVLARYCVMRSPVASTCGCNPSSDHVACVLPGLFDGMHLLLLIGLARNPRLICDLSHCSTKVGHRRVCTSKPVVPACAPAAGPHTSWPLHKSVQNAECTRPRLLLKQRFKTGNLQKRDQLRGTKCTRVSTPALASHFKQSLVGQPLHVHPQIPNLTTKVLPAPTFVLRKLCGANPTPLGWVPRVRPQI